MRHDRTRVAAGRDLHRFTSQVHSRPARKPRQRRLHGFRLTVESFCHHLSQGLLLLLLRRLTERMAVAASVRTEAVRMRIGVGPILLWIRRVLVYKEAGVALYAGGFPYDGRQQAALRQPARGRVRAPDQEAGRNDGNERIPPPPWTRTNGALPTGEGFAD